MRKALALVAMAFGCCQAQEQPPLPDRFGNTYSLPSLPSQATPTTYQQTPIQGLSVGNNTDTQTRYEKQELHGGVTVINESGNRNRLTVCQTTSGGQVVCN